jgi:hypothetical protein
LSPVVCRRDNPPTNNWRQRQTNTNNIDNPPTNNWRQRQTNRKKIDNTPTNNWRQRQTNTNKKKNEILTQCYTYQRLYYRLYYSNGFGLFED